MRKYRNQWILAFLLSFLNSLQAFGWGKIGHETVALIAAENLTPTTRESVQRLLVSDDLPTASLWPDIIRPLAAWEHTKGYHFTGVPDGSNYLASLRALPVEKRPAGDAVRAFLKAESVLRDQRASSQEKAYALRFLVHIVGDIHQPLHTGRPEDRGGNSVFVEWFGRKSNAHGVWDSGIIEAILRMSKMWVAQDVRQSAENTLSYRRHLPKPKPEIIGQWSKSYVLDWHAESVQIRDKAYTVTEIPNVTYVHTRGELVDLRILQAGYRLAALLNSIFSSADPFRSQAQKLSAELTEILGKGHEAMIHLKPQTNTDTKAHKSMYDSSAARYFSGQFDDCGHHH